MNASNENSNEKKYQIGRGFSSEYSISARIGKHFCPYCNSLLQIRRKKQIVNSESEEVKNFSYYAYGGNMRGDTEFNWDVFYCPDCDKEIPTGDMISYERKLRKTGEIVDFDAFRKNKYCPDKKTNKWRFFLYACLVALVFTLIIIMISNFSL